MTDLVWTPIKIKIGQVVPWAENPRMSTKVQANRLIKSERELGQIQTLAVSPFVEAGRVLLYDGHQRCAAWLTVKDPSYEVTALQSNRMLTDDERRKVSVLLHTATGSWNWESLSSWSAADLREWGMDNDTLKGWNTDANNLKELLNAEQEEPVDAEPQIDRAAELAEKWHTETGQLWKLGEHRLLIGDCTVQENVERLMGGERAGACVTDPPYGIGYEYDEYDDVKGNEYESFCDKWFELCVDFAPVVVISTGWAYKPYWYSKHPKGEMVWFDKTKQSGHSTAHLRKTEPIFIFGKLLNKWDWDIFEFEGVRGDGMRDLHTCPKPVSLWELLIDRQTEINGIIYEPFGGSGTTIIAAHNLNRRCFAMEISEKYGAVILERFFTATGITPELVE